MKNNNKDEQDKGRNKRKAGKNTTVFIIHVSPNNVDIEVCIEMTSNEFLRNGI